MGIFLKHNGQYSITQDEDGAYQYSDGAIESVYCHRDIIDGVLLDETEVTVTYRNGNCYKWTISANCCGNSYLQQFGVTVSYDGRFLFCQTWERGLYALDARTGATVWKTRSKRGITSVFANRDTLICCQHNRALQLLDMNTGEVLKEVRTTAWGFTAIDSKRIVCQVYEKKWCVIDAEALDILRTFSSNEFTDNHADYRVNFIQLINENTLQISGFQNVWDDSTKPPKRLPNLVFTNYIVL
ncbi:MAG: PQQ-binding-like beta-propeller repeat protein [Eubacteriales bacterium]|nr:PQQ-binding-like beta-propeller repeat protein [Eubacteriales bacterium]